MTNTWRPENWENPYPENEKYLGMARHMAFEIGADAMLNALKGQGIYETNKDKGSEITLVHGSAGTGWLVIIPEEVKQ